MATITTIKNDTRAKAFNAMVEIFGAKYGIDNVYRIGDSELAICVDTAPTSEPIFITVSPTVKDYCERKTSTKTVKAFDINAAVAAYENKVNSREVKAAENAEKKAAKIAADKKRREERAAEKAAKAEK